MRSYVFIALLGEHLADMGITAMQSENHIERSEQQAQGPSYSNLSDYFRVIYKYRKFICCIVGVTSLASIIISLMLPKTYVATARVLPPHDNNSGISSSFLDSVDSHLSGLADSLSINKTPAALYVGIMKSRSVADALIQRFNLKEQYNKKYIEDVYVTLAERSKIDVSKKDLIITVSVEDHDPQRAADMANEYVNMLDRINRKLNITQGKRKRLFLEGRLNEVRSNLEKAELSLKSFQEKYNIVAIEEQAKVAIEGAAEIKGQIIATQIELEVLKQFGTEKQIEAVMLKTKIEELHKQLEAIEQGEKLISSGSVQSELDRPSNFYIPFDDLPHLSLHLMRLTRETKIQEKLFELIISQYEMAQIDEAKDINTIQVLDEAVSPEKKSSPKRSNIVISSGMISLLISILLSFVFESIRPTFFQNKFKPESK
jgi:uncharacterized protein involved in exopolysaccharide biosynthesis